MDACHGLVFIPQDGESLGRYRAEIGVAAGRVVVVGGASAFTVFPLDQV